jgi:hypothetical protein
MHEEALGHHHVSDDDQAKDRNSPTLSIQPILSITSSDTV